jgi:hypothetical protein
MRQNKETHEKPIWERLPREPSSAFRAFTIFRDMGPRRSRIKVAEQLGKGYGWIKNLAVKWRWEERVRAFEDYLDQIKIEAMKKEIEEMARRHIQQSMIFQQVLIRPAEALIKKIRNGEESFERLPLEKLFDKSVAAAQVFNKLVDIERKSRGEPNEISKQDITSNGEPLKVILPKISLSHDDLSNDKNDDI